MFLIPFEIRNSLDEVIVSGILQDRVSRSDNTGELIFEPRLRDLIGDGVSIFELKVTGYNGFTADVDFRTDGLGDVGPSQVSRAGGDELFYEYVDNQRSCRLKRATSTRHSPTPHNFN